MAHCGFEGRGAGAGENALKVVNRLVEEGHALAAEPNFLRRVRLAGGLSPADLDALARLAITDGVMPGIRATARFNWHSELILQTLRHPGVLLIVLRRFLGVTPT